MSDDFCRAVRQTLPDIAQSVVTAMENDLADCRARLAEVEAENERLREALAFCKHAALHGSPSQAVIVKVSRALAQTNEPGHDVALCEDCPPEDYPTNKTRCDECPRRPRPDQGAEP